MPAGTVTAFCLGPSSPPRCASIPPHCSADTPLSFVGLISGTTTTTASGHVSVPSPLVVGSMAKPFSLASSFPPIPCKLALKIQSLQFVEMRELLPDNLTIAEDALSRPPDQRPKQREVSSILSWVSAFATYIAVTAEAHPDRVKDMLAYLRIIVKEAARSNNKGWLNYDRIFRQNAVSDPTLSWARLDSSLHSSYCIGGPSEALRVACPHCNEFDHSAEECALSQTCFSGVKVPSSSYQQPSMSYSSGFNSHHSSGHNRFSSSRPPKKGIPRNKKICLSWNGGKCILPGSCEYSHICATCYEAHRARDCSATPEDSMFKRSGSAAKRSRGAPDVA